jgi:hypothetical protein
VDIKIKNKNRDECEINTKINNNKKFFYIEGLVSKKYSIWGPVD